MELDEPAAPATKSKRHVREVSALRAWHAVLASFLLFAPPVANAETVKIIDDRGGLIIAYQMQWATLTPQGVNVQIKGPCVSAWLSLDPPACRPSVCASDVKHVQYWWYLEKALHASISENCSRSQPATPHFNRCAQRPVAAPRHGFKTEYNPTELSRDFIPVW